jgi:hypothetical protein
MHLYGDDPTIYINSTSNGWAAVKWNTTQPANACGFFEATRNGKSRWSVEFGTSEAETGANVGTNFGINCFDDTGALLSTPFRIMRATGQVVISGPTALVGSVEIGNQSVASYGILDFHTSGLANDFDSRIIAISGTGSATMGQGTLQIQTGALNIFGTVALNGATTVSPVIVSSLTGLGVGGGIISHEATAQKAAGFRYNSAIAALEFGPASTAGLNSVGMTLSDAGILTVSQGRLISIKPGAAGSVAVSDGNASHHGMFINGTGLAFGPTLVDATPAALWIGVKRQGIEYFGLGLNQNIIGFDWTGTILNYYIDGTSFGPILTETNEKALLERIEKLETQIEKLTARSK